MHLSLQPTIVFSFGTKPSKQRQRGIPLGATLHLVLGPHGLPSQAPPLMPQPAALSLPAGGGSAVPSGCSAIGGGITIALGVAAIGTIGASVTMFSRISA